MTDGPVLRLGDAAPDAEPASARMPDLLLAAEAGWLRPEGPFPARGLLLRLRSTDEDDATLQEACRSLAHGGMLDLEVVLPEEAECGPGLDALALRLARMGLFPRHVAALPEPQLGGVIPQEPTPQACTEAVAAAFPEAQVGLGVLTSFAGDRRPTAEAPGHYVTLGASAVGPGAADAAVLEALEVLPQVFADARAAAGTRALRLGLVSMALRPWPGSRSHGTDPRQKGLLAAAYAVAACAAAAKAGAEAVALAAPAGPFGIVGDSGEARLLLHVHAGLHAAADRVVRVDPVPGLRGIAWEGGAVLANASLVPVTVPAPFATGAHLSADALEAARNPDWLSLAAGPLPGEVTLGPCEVLFAGEAAQSL
ncbi:hypothetical protein FHG66_03845 [Rubellimicrobium rubrum]|uniref:D-apionate lactonase TIM barrel domain-containing protein n=1 Tax=Rubellimicrobium rubrum TaxID=2585369 RepID=A0A5C4N5N3_9RHOB|nr:hypothetical protein [Rubellimicrobium rubrum]TNC51949.1 hypothetical protein FHG66_03845 [Rubellimicrobium rubrum]